MPSMDEHWKYHVFISHASEDKDAVARPLAEALSKCGLQVWYDEFSLKLGDSLRQSIENGLSQSQFGIVILSQSFFAKAWPNIELSALISRSIAEGKVVLPVWHDVTKDDVLRRSLFLADALAVDWKEGIEVVVSKILEAIPPSQRPPKTSLTTVELAAWSKLYHFDGGHVKAIRLFGADDDCIPEKRVQLHYNHSFKSLEPELQKFRDDCKSSLRSWNGPNTRLSAFDWGTADDCWNALEQTTVQLHLGPVNWHDYEALNINFFGDHIGGINATLENYEKYTGLSHMLDDGDISHSKLSDICSTATTILTQDGYVAYVERSRRGTQPQKFTSAIAENINRYKDDANIKNSWELFNASVQAVGDDKNSTYAPKDVPHPFAAVRRGLREELSPELPKYIGPDSVKLIGVCFDLVAAHPDLLFVLPIPLCRQEIEHICRTIPAKDAPERKGDIMFFPVKSNNPDDYRDLRDSDRWIPGGQASVVRTLELVRQATKEEDFNVFFKKLIAA